jgi:hypothetical protein
VLGPFLPPYWPGLLSHERITDDAGSNPVGGTMVVYGVYSLADHSVIFATDNLDRAKALIRRKLEQGYWSQRSTTIYCPYLIFDMWVHTNECTCPTFCDGPGEDD